MTVPAPAASQASSSDLPNWRGASSTRASSTGKGRPQTSTRAKSQPKQRNSKPKPAKPSAYELGVTQARTYAESATPEQLETRLQQLLRAQQYADAAFLIAASAHLSARFQTADVVRLMLEQVKSSRALEQAVQLVRDLQLQHKDELVTLLINEMVRGLQFGAAVRVAQEMVPGFQDLSGAATERPSWTPPALIQAMIRAGRFRAALKFAKQFNLLETFPAPQLVAGMLERRSWEEAVSSVMEFQLFQEFPLEALAVKMMQHRQWAQAVKCINKLADSDTRVKFQEAVVREMAHVGDFVTALRYLREFKLDQGKEQATVSLLRFLVDAMIAHSEFYKAVKYSIKFGLAKNPLDDAIAAAEAALAAANGETVEPTKVEDDVEYLPQYSVETLLRRAIEGGQFHVATTYIKKLRMREHFADELVAIEQAKQNRLLEFRQYVQLRLGEFQDPARQQSLKALLSAQPKDEMVELDPVEVEIIISEEQEVFPRKKKVSKPLQEDECKPITEEVQALVIDDSTSTEEITEVQEQGSSVCDETAGQSRFGFARASPPPPSVPVPTVPVVDTDNDEQTRSKSVPLGRSAPPPGLFCSNSAEREQESTNSSVGSFNFADFASSVQANAPPLPPTSSSQPLQQQQSFVNLQPPQQQQQNPAMFNNSMPPMPNGSFSGGAPGYPMPPPMMSQQNPMYYSRGNMPPGSMLPNQSHGFPQPPPPPPTSNNGGGAFNVAALAMQFHNAGGSNGSSGFGGFGGPRPPMGYPGGQQLYPGMPPPPFGAPPLPPQSSFKPSMAYTSVTTTRQKK
ncbi:hypothetical protein PHYBOEH_000850 [Phytophthora boehmeriae]|uniref:Uncharacterized protein n=1 Tax=Phytophthora boehmeriae TaxID=109152 RepID=A0A8T1WYL7_9STRA|nr:hypothetical protein PHYBOEH_000850 [Phytophthora boehmeriae]